MGDLDLFALSTGLIGGLALFLFGMDIMTDALKSVAGNYMKTLLAKVTQNRFLGMATGAAVTAIIQSSSITTVLLVGFISAGLMSTSQSVAVILGANIGTTITAQILAFKVTKLALPMLALGFFVSFTAKKEKWRQYGLIVMGLGLIFFGMAIMSDAMKPLRDFQPFLDFMISMNNPLLAAAVGAGFTALVQSSSATTGILIVMASQGLINLEAAIALALGANVGTCITAAIASIGKPREAVRAALVHTVFNVIGVLIWIGFVSQLADFSRIISPSHPELAGLSRMGAEVPRQIANIHTFFNVVNALLFIGFTTQLTNFVEWLVPDKPLKEDERFATRFLDDEFLDTPAIALDAARREIVRLGGFVREMLAAAMPTAATGTLAQLEEIKAMDKPVDALHRGIVGYLRKCSLGNISSQESDLLMALIKIANDLESIGDQVASNILRSARKRIDENVVVSNQTAKAIGDIHQVVLATLDKSIAALDQENVDLAMQAREMKHDFAKMIEAIEQHEISRLKADEPQRLMTYAREVELVELLDGIFKTTRRIARTQLPLFENAALSEEEKAAQAGAAAQEDKEEQAA
jgi:phosphate:Na+ symporter